MNKMFSVALVASLSGLLGGLLTRYVAPPAAFAQNATPAPNQIRARSFALVDEAGRVVGAFMFEPQLNGTAGPKETRGRIVLRNSEGREIWSAGGTELRPLLGTR